MSKKRWVLSLFLILLVFFVTAVGFLIYLMLPKAPSVTTGTTVEVILDEPLRDLPSPSPIAQLMNPRVPSLWDLSRLFRAAARDGRVKGIYLEIHPLQGWSWGQVEEVRDLIKQFRASGKPVHAYLSVDMVGELEYYLGAAANSLTLPPESGFEVNGLLAEVTFFKRTMEKLNIQPEFIQFKEYKSPEIYEREKMSPEIREMYRSLLGDLEHRFIETVSADRRVDPAIFQPLISRGIEPSEAALKDGLVDSLAYSGDVKDRFQGQGDYHGMEASKYLNSVGSSLEPSGGTKIALVGGIGTIVAGNSDPFGQVLGASTLVSYLRQIRQDVSIKGVILRVDSPGGSATGSDMVWRQVRLLEESGKPVIVSMSGVAGSGGYYISMGAGRIISQPSTITGSIGVIFGKFDLEGLYNWLGMKVDQVKTAKNADIFSLHSRFSEEQRQTIKEWMASLYHRFVEKAARGRGMKFEDLEPRAHGRVYTGAQALKIGLVDELGGFQTAMKDMKAALNLGPAQHLKVVLYPRPRTLWESLSSGDLFRVSLRQDRFSQWLDRHILVLTQPAAWVLMPDIQIR